MNTTEEIKVLHQKIKELERQLDGLREHVTTENTKTRNMITAAMKVIKEHISVTWQSIEIPQLGELLNEFITLKKYMEIRMEEKTNDVKQWFKEKIKLIIA